MDESECERSYVVRGDFLVDEEPILRGIYYVCGKTAYFNLPHNWVGSYYLALVFPRIYCVSEMNDDVLRRVKHGFG